ncbi:MAG TPA: nucleoside hydrolase [Microbacteriaceae bacterium]|nr:nucleoside hydrolase [Microbacteriaceae bacterium]
MPTKMILDCDTGIDDAMAIMYAALHPSIDLLAVGTVWGNVPVSMATRNTVHVLGLAGRTAIPVAQGAAGPLLGGPVEYAFAVHGDDGQGGAYDGTDHGPSVPISAARQIVETVRANPHEVWLVPVGPLTNIALALALEPALPRLVKGVSLMGGAALAPGNFSPVAEANIAHDPEAAAAVFRAPWPIVMAGLDVTMKILLTPAHRATLAAGGAAGAYLARVLGFYGDFYAATAFDTWSAAIHDPIAVAAAAGTLGIRRAPTVRVEVDCTAGPSRGATVCDLRGRHPGTPAQEGAHCTVLLDADDTIASDIVALIAAA